MATPKSPRPPTPTIERLNEIIRDHGRESMQADFFRAAKGRRLDFEAKQLSTWEEAQNSRAPIDAAKYPELARLEELQKSGGIAADLMAYSRRRQLRAEAERMAREAEGDGNGGGGSEPPAAA